MSHHPPSKVSPSRPPTSPDMPELQMAVPLEQLSAEDLKYQAVQTLGRAQAVCAVVLDALWHHGEGNPGQASLNDLHLATSALMQQLEFAITLVFGYWPEPDRQNGGEA